MAQNHANIFIERTFGIKLFNNQLVLKLNRKFTKKINRDGIYKVESLKKNSWNLIILIKEIILSKIERSTVK